ncbi:FAD-dependent oxidoreductase, partial [Candidatus Bathyarchaeota archaeon]|nr:FAD-dependent oxidoreductase [Candidatus Bathyarchaeota archaeon]
MEKFDVLVVGSGSGMIVAANAVNNNMKTALVEFGPLGGTCLNRGCVPSKMLIYPADVVTMIKEAGAVGVKATVDSIDFKNIMNRMHELVKEDVERQERAMKVDSRIRWFRGKGEFISDYTMKIGEDEIKAEKIFIVSGARPNIPSIKGVEKTRYLTSDSLLQL